MSNFSITAAEKYKVALVNTNSATGVFFFFIDLVNTDTQNRYMLVLTTSDNTEVVSATDLIIQDIKDLALSRVDIACMTI